MAERDGSSDADLEAGRHRRRWSRIIWFGLGFLILALIAPGVRLWRADTPNPLPSPSSVDPPDRAIRPLTAEQVERCDDMLRKGAELGLIRRRPQPARIDVDESLWSAMDAKARNGLLLALQCSASSRNTAHPATIHAFGSGRQLAQASARSGDFE